MIKSVQIVCVTRTFDRSAWGRPFSREGDMTTRRKKIGTLTALGGWLFFAPLLAGAKEALDKETFKLTTRDGVKLAITYYPSDAGKEAVPVVMLHDFKESRYIFGKMAEALQDPESGGRSHAVVTVDLRGHGESTVQTAPNGRTRDLQPTKLRPADFELMYLQDMEEVRRFLVERNDRGELNLNNLTLVGAGMGANVAMYWAAKDWATPPLATRKQGQDVKAIVLSSPEWGFKGLPLLEPVRQPGLRSQVSFLVVYGQQLSVRRKDASNFLRNLKKYQPDPPPDKVKEMKSLFDVPLDTKLQSTQLLVSDEFKMLPDVEQFINLRVTEQNFRWEKRK